MKAGNISSLVAMATELDRRMEAKKDFIAPTSKIFARDDGNIFLGERGLVPTDHFRRQVATHFKIPNDYAERIRVAHPILYAETLNTHFKGEPATRMIRTMDGKARAFLSDRYRPLDNHDLVAAVLPVLMDQPDIQIQSIDVSDNRFFLKAVFPRLTTEVKVGDVVQMGLQVGNSEVGLGGLNIVPFIYTLRCLNGMTSMADGLRRTHLGKRNEADDNVLEFMTDQTRRLDDAAFFSKVRDVVKGTLNEVVMQRIVGKMRDATQEKLDPAKLTEIVEVTGEKFGYTETTRKGILAHLINDAGANGLTRYGLMNAITRQSQDEESYELATQMEADGGKIIELARSDWKAIAEAA